MTEVRLSGKSEMNLPILNSLMPVKMKNTTVCWLSEDALIAVLLMISMT